MRRPRRRLRDPDICDRVRELQSSLCEGVIAAEISNRNNRVQVLQKRWERLRDALDRLLDQRGAEMCDVPGGDSGILCREYKGIANTPVVRVDPGVISLAFTLLAHERQAAAELNQWKAPEQQTKVTIDATPAAMALATVLSRAELLELEAKLKAAEEAGAGA